MSFFFQNAPFTDDSSLLDEMVADSVFLNVQSSIVANPVKSFQYPSTLEQLRCATFFKVREEVYLAEENVEQVGPEEGWRRIGGKDFWFYSKWGANFAKYLHLLQISEQITGWSYQPQTFPMMVKGVCCEYTPDFKGFRSDGSHFWLEINDAEKDQVLWKKTGHFRTDYPEETLALIDINWFRNNTAMLKERIPDWEDCW
jgi:hypothetical protein